VVLISDVRPAENCEWIDSKELLEDVGKFEAVYAHMSTNSKTFEMICIKRWIILRNYMMKYGIPNVYYSDSDVMIYDDLSSLYEHNYKNFEVCYTLPAYQDNYRWTASACCSYWSLKSIKAFCDFIFHCYDKTGIKKLEEKWNYHLQNNISGGVCDMTLLYLFHDKLNFQSLSAEYKGIAFDQNFTDGENYLKEEYEREPGFGLQVKKIEWVNEQPHAFNLKLKKKVRFAVLTEYAKLLLNAEENKSKPDFFLQITKRIVNKLLRLFRTENKSRHGWFGDYKTWAEAKSKCSGYDSGIIFDKVLSSVSKVKKGEAVYERDSVLFSQIQYSLPLLQALKTAGVNGELNLVDFGGSLGSTYFQNRDLLYAIKKMKWAIVEQKHFVEGGKKNIEDESLKFFYDIPSAVEFAGKRAILLSSVIPYFEKPYELISEITGYGFEYIIIDRTAFIDSEKERITVQIVPESIYKASYPAWFLNEDKFKKAFLSGYELIDEFNSKFDPEEFLEDGKRAYRKGFLFKLKK